MQRPGVDVWHLACLGLGSRAAISIADANVETFDFEFMDRRWSWRIPAVSCLLIRWKMTLASYILSRQPSSSGLVCSVAISEMKFLLTFAPFFRIRRCIETSKRRSTDSVSAGLKFTTVFIAVVDIPRHVLWSGTYRLWLINRAEQYLQSPLQFEHACTLLLDSELFEFHSERMCEIIVDDAQAVSASFFHRNTNWFNSLTEHKSPFPTSCLLYSPSLRASTCRIFSFT